MADGASKSLFALCTLVFTDGRAKIDKPESGKSRKYSQLRQRAIIYFILEHGSKTCARRMGSVGRNKHTRVHCSTAGKEREKMKKERRKLAYDNISVKILVMFPPASDAAGLSSGRTFERTIWSNLSECHFLSSSMALALLGFLFPCESGLPRRGCMRNS